MCSVRGDQKFTRTSGILNIFIYGYKYIYINYLQLFFHQFSHLTKLLLMYSDLSLYPHYFLGPSFSLLCCERLVLRASENKSGFTMSNVDVSNPLGAGGDHEKGALESKDLCMYVLGWGDLVGFG